MPEPVVTDEAPAMGATPPGGPAWRAWLGGWRRAPWGSILLASGAGATAVLGLPPFGWWWAALGGFALLLGLLAQGVTPRRGALLGFLFGLGHFLPGFAWLLTSLHEHGHLSWPVSYAMLTALAGGMALYPALFGALLCRLSPRSALWPVVAPSLWVVTEWLRATLFTGFPWNLAGYMWDGWEQVVQLAAVGGVWLLSWLLLLLAALVARAWLGAPNWREVGEWLMPIPLLLLFIHAYGADRLEKLGAWQAEQLGQRAEAGLRVGLVQGNIAQHLKWSPEYRRKAIGLYSGLSWELVNRVDLVMWPETAITEFLQFHPDWVRELAHLSRGVGAPLLVGTHMADLTDQPGRWDYFNSMVLIGPEGTLEDRYDKHHLVPFGEYIPMRQFAPSTFKKFTEGTQDFATGPGSYPLAWDKGALGCLVCYEVIFPNEVRELAQAGARWLMNATNDGWFGETAKPQHLAMARLRAVENRLPLARAANTGISVAFDQTGRELGRIEPNERQVLVVTLPPGTGESFFRLTGDLFWVGWMAALTLGVAALEGQWPTRLRQRLAAWRSGGWSASSSWFQRTRRQPRRRARSRERLTWGGRLRAWRTPAGAEDGDLPVEPRFQAAAAEPVPSMADGPPPAPLLVPEGGERPPSIGPSLRTAKRGLQLDRPAAGERDACPLLDRDLWGC